MLLAPFLWIFCEFDEKVLDNLSLARQQNQYWYHVEQDLHRLISRN